MKPLVKNAADEGQVRDAKQKEKGVRDHELNDVRAVLATLAGRRFIWRYMGLCGLNRISAHQSGSWTYFHEGERNIGLKLQTDVVEANPNALIEMMKENKENENG